MHRAQNFTPDTYAKKRVAGVKRKYSRQRQTCHPCRTRKIACDRAPTCGNCLRQGRPEDCSYGVREELGYPPATTATASVNNAGQALTLRKRSHTQDPAPIEGTETNNLDYAVHIFSAVPTRDVLVGKTLSPVTRNAPPLKGKLTPKGAGKSFFIGDSAWTAMDHDGHIIFSNDKAFKRQNDAIRELKMFFSKWRSGTVLDCLGSSCAPTSLKEDLIAAVPDQKTCGVLMERFLITFNMSHPVVDPDSFRRDVSAFWERDWKQETPDLWLAMFVAVLAVGYQLPVLPLSPGKPTVAGSQKKGKELISLVRSIAFSHTTSSRPDVTSFQILLLLILSQSLVLDWVDGNDLKNGLLSLARCAAFTMGLHRDPASALFLSAQEKDVRRMLWKTFSFIDLEHAVQSGMPFLLGENSSLQTLPVKTFASARTAYPDSIIGAFAIWGTIARPEHSSEAQSPEQIRQTCKRLEEIDIAVVQQSCPPESVRKGTARIPQIIQDVSLRCFNHRMKMLLFSPRIDHTEDTLRIEATRVILDSALTILDHEDKLRDLVEDECQPSCNAWAHFIFSVLRCTFYYAANAVTRLVQQLSSDDFRNILGVEPFDLLESLSGRTRFADLCLAISPTCVKENVCYHAQLCGAKERLRLGFEPGRDKVVFRAPRAWSIIWAMQESLDRSLEKSKTILQEAQKMVDIPPALCEAGETSLGVCEQKDNALLPDREPDIDAMSPLAGFEWDGTVVSNPLCLRQSTLRTTDYGITNSKEAGQLAICIGPFSKSALGLFQSFVGVNNESIEYGS